MATNVNQSSLQAVEALYPRSWIDQLIGWIDLLPGPVWLFYLAATLVLAATISVTLWIDGSVPFGSYGSFQGIFPPFVFYFLGLYHYLTRVGSSALTEFRPLLEVDDSEFAQIDYELATLPHRLGWMTIGITLATLPGFFMSGEAFGDHVPNTALPYFVAAASAVFFGATLFCLIIRSLRQLRVVHKLHARATNINLLKLEPAHAFSGLTARAGIGIILLLILGYVRDPSAFQGAWLISGNLIMAGPAIIVFLAPIMGMRDRLTDEKKRVINQTTDLLQSTSNNLESKIRDNDYGDLQGMETAIRALTRRLETLEKISTWPWNPGTIRGFASTLLLPIILWLITHFLGRFF